MSYVRKYRSLLSQKLHALAYHIDRIGDEVYVDPPDVDELLLMKEQSHKDWVVARGDDVLKYDYSLDSTSVVFDVGGFNGDWASNIFSMYQCYVHIFEPVSTFSQHIEWRFRNNKKIILHRMALGSKDENAIIYLQDNASSVYGEGDSKEVIEVKKFPTVLTDLGIEKIDLMKINIEGLEYDLLNNIIDEGCIECVDRLLIQFHEFVPDAVNQMEALQDRLSLTHRPVFQYPFIWESWSKK